MDTTLRDGEQTPNVAYAPSEKVQIARLLLREVNVDRIEIANAGVSEGEAEAVRRITAWARKARLSPRIEILGYVDGRKSVDWIVANGGAVMNLLTKGSRNHCEKQLRMTPERHFKDVAETIRYARKRKLIANVYLEDWSSGVRDSFDYVFASVENLSGLGVKRIYLPDTLGILSPERHHALRLADDAHLAGPALRIPLAQRLRARDGELPGGRRGGRPRGPHQRERHGRALGECAARRGRGVDPRPRAVRTNVRENKLTQISEMVATFSAKIVADNCAGGRARRLHPDRGHPRGRRLQSRSLRQPPGPAALRAEAALRPRKDVGQGLPRPEPEGAGNQAPAREPRARAPAHRGARRQEAHGHTGRSADDHRRRLEEAAGRASRSSATKSSRPTATCPPRGCRCVTAARPSRRIPTATAATTPS